MGPGQAVVETKELTKKIRPRHGAGPTDAVRRAGADPRLRRTQRRGQDDHHQDPRRSGPADERLGDGGRGGLRHRRRKLKRLVGYMPDTFGSYDNMRVGEYLDFFGAAFGMPRRDRRGGSARCWNSPGQLFPRSVRRNAQPRHEAAGGHRPDAAARPGSADPGRAGQRPRPAGAHRDAPAAPRPGGERGKTLLVTSHILPELARICHRVAIITRGRLRAWARWKRSRANFSRSGRWRCC